MSPDQLDQLAITVVAHFLMPFVKKGVSKIAQEVGEKVGEPAAKFAGDITAKVWARVKSVFTSPEEQVTLSQFEKRPDDAAPLLKSMLKEKLEQDRDLADELDKLINTLAPGIGSTGAQIMNAGVAGIVNLQGADFSKSQNTKISGVHIGNAAEISTTEPEATDDLPN